jgi:hypothetical protein
MPTGLPSFIAKSTREKRVMRILSGIFLRPSSALAMKLRFPLRVWLEIRTNKDATQQNHIFSFLSHPLQGTLGCCSNNILRNQKCN